MAVFALDLILDLICLGTASDRIGTHPPARGLIHTSVGASVYSVSDGCPVTLPMIQETTPRQSDGSVGAGSRPRMEVPRS